LGLLLEDTTVMYSTLGSIDIVAADKTGGEMYVQTDHRERAELEAEPEITVLFGLTRMLKARAHAASKSAKATVVYASFTDDPPAFLIELVAAAGGVLERASDQQRVAIPKVDVTPSELADRAYRALAQRVCRRVGLEDFAAALHALEAETLLEPPDAEEDEIGYWTRVVELAAVVGEILRARTGGRWIEHEDADVPFGFQCADDQVLLPTNRAARFIADGEGETMFALLRLQANNEAMLTGPRNMLPSLRSRADAVGEKMVFRPLLKNVGDDDGIPVIVYGNDTPQAFAIMREPTTADLDQIHAEAIANLPAQEVTTQRMDLGGVPVIAVSGSFYATEKILDRAFMRGLQQQLGNPMLVVSVPRRGLMFVTSGVEPDPRRASAVLATITNKEATTTRSISSALLIVSDGEVVGHVKLELGDEPGPDDEPPPRKPPGFLKRLFGRA
jgi:hypothetical protein